MSPNARHNAARGWCRCRTGRAWRACRARCRATRACTTRRSTLPTWPRPTASTRPTRSTPCTPATPATRRHRLRPLLGLPAAFCLLESVQSLECALTCSLRPLLRARLLKRGFVRDARQEGGTRGAGVQVHRAYQPYEVTKPNSLRKADLIRLSLCAGGRIRRSPERRWRGLPGRGRIRRARRRAGRGPRRAAGRQVPGLQRARRAPAPPLRILACLVACMGACL